MKSQKGQSLVEFALVVPIIALLLFGMVDFGRAYHVHLTLDHAGRETARAASIHEENIVDVAITNASSINLDASNVFIKYEDEDGDEVAYDTTEENVIITITYPFQFITPIISNLVDDFTLTNNTTMRMN